MELVDEHMKEKEREIDERYSSFDQNIPDVWKDDQLVDETTSYEDKLRDKIPEESAGDMVMEPEKEMIINKDTLSEVV